MDDVDGMAWLARCNSKKVTRICQQPDGLGGSTSSVTVSFERSEKLSLVVGVPALIKAASAPFGEKTCKTFKERRRPLKPLKCWLPPHPSPRGCGQARSGPWHPLLEQPAICFCFGVHRCTGLGYFDARTCLPPMANVIIEEEQGPLEPLCPNM